MISSAGYFPLKIQIIFEYRISLSALGDCFSVSHTNWKRWFTEPQLNNYSRKIAGVVLQVSGFCFFNAIKILNLICEISDRERINEI